MNMQFPPVEQIFVHAFPNEVHTFPNEVYAFQTWGIEMDIELTSTTIKPVPVMQQSRQNRKIGNTILIAYQQIETSQSNPEIAAGLAERGYDKAKLDEGMALYRAAQAAYNARQQAIGDQQDAS
jgi:hypothetical protein